MNGKIRTRWLGICTSVLAVLVLFVVAVYAYDSPGGIADWRFSRAIGNNWIMQIPVGKTPDDAVQKFRGITNNQVIHQEKIDGGAILFYKNNENKEGSDLQIEIVHHTWLGWKWVWGGGYSISNGTDSDVAFDYMSMPRSKGLHGPFPILVGQVMDSNVDNVTVTFDGDNAATYDAKLIPIGAEEKLWYVVLPASATAPFKIDASNADHKLIASTTFTDPHNSESVCLTS
ncbi:hypothetical protein [Paenibacillus lupini]|uniref:hypothetical protein n=1 Tax=Paenibacillus lupini TaxID=1450204 RepID=UPI00141E7B24|nr:hypothetical protein [Paenibacillus lupini]NIK21043.1 hypothetical protein [Paenibacillus lupini]